MDVNKSPAEYDRVNIFCPHRAAAGTSTNDSEGSGNGYYIIYNVSKEEYETCRVTNPAARRMLVCDSPASERRSYVTITFRPFSPQPNGPEFHAGHDYYFICKFKRGLSFYLAYFINETRNKIINRCFPFCKISICLPLFGFKCLQKRGLRSLILQMSVHLSILFLISILVYLPFFACFFVKKLLKKSIRV